MTKSIDELLEQLKFKRKGTEEDGITLDPEEHYSDYEFGAEEREAAAKELGELGDPKAVPYLAKALNDEGDFKGCTAHRLSFPRDTDGGIRVGLAALASLIRLYEEKRIQEAHAAIVEASQRCPHPAVKIMAEKYISNPSQKT